VLSALSGETFFLDLNRSGWADCSLAGVTDLLESWLAVLVLAFSVLENLIGFTDDSETSSVLEDVVGWASNSKAFIFDEVEQSWAFFDDAFTVDEFRVLWAFGDADLILESESGSASTSTDASFIDQSESGWARLEEALVLD
jgi:hypothetical protein